MQPIGQEPDQLIGALPQNLLHNFLRMEARGATCAADSPSPAILENHYQHGFTGLDDLLIQLVALYGLNPLTVLPSGGAILQLYFTSNELKLHSDESYFAYKQKDEE